MDTAISLYETCVYIKSFTFIPSIELQHQCSLHFQEISATQVFNNQAFLRKRSRSTNEPPGPMVILAYTCHFNPLAYA